MILKTTQRNSRSHLSTRIPAQFPGDPCAGETAVGGFSVQGRGIIPAAAENSASERVTEPRPSPWTAAMGLLRVRRLPRRAAILRVVEIPIGLVAVGARGRHRVAHFDHGIQALG